VQRKKPGRKRENLTWIVKRSRGDFGRGELRKKRRRKERSQIDRRIMINVKWVRQEVRGKGEGGEKCRGRRREKGPCDGSGGKRDHQTGPPSYVTFN